LRATFSGRGNSGESAFSLDVDVLCQCGTAMRFGRQREAWQLPRFLLRVNRGLVHQHDGDVVAHRINASALITLKSVILFRQRRFADRTDQNLEQSFVDHFGNFTPNAND
jgi:hypothetical protein